MEKLGRNGDDAALENRMRCLPAQLAFAIFHHCFWISEVATGNIRSGMGLTIMVSMVMSEWCVPDNLHMLTSINKFPWQFCDLHNPI